MERSTLHQSASSILTSTISQGRLLWSTSKKLECYHIFIKATTRAITLLPDADADGLKLQKALDTAASRNVRGEDVTNGDSSAGGGSASGSSTGSSGSGGGSGSGSTDDALVSKQCVILRKAFNVYLSKHRPPTTSFEERTSRAEQAERLVILDLTPKLESLRKRAAESAQKFGDEPGSDATLRHVTLSRRVPSMSSMPSMPTSLSTSATSSEKEPDAAPPSPPSSLPSDDDDLETILSKFDQGPSTHSTSTTTSSTSISTLAYHRTILSLVSRTVMRVKRDEVENHIKRIIQLSLTILSLHPNDVQINYHW